MSWWFCTFKSMFFSALRSTWILYLASATPAFVIARGREEEREREIQSELVAGVSNYDWMMCTKPNILHVLLSIPPNLNTVIAVSLRRICDDSFELLASCMCHGSLYFVFFFGFYDAIMRRSRLNEKSQSVVGINQVYGYFLVMWQLSIQRIVCGTAPTLKLRSRNNNNNDRKIILICWLQMHALLWEGTHFPNSFISKFTFYYNPFGWCGKSALFAVLIKNCAHLVCRAQRKLVEFHWFRKLFRIVIVNFGKFLKFWNENCFFRMFYKISLLLRLHVMSHFKVALPPLRRS